MAVELLEKQVRPDVARRPLGQAPEVRPPQRRPTAWPRIGRYGFGTMFVLGALAHVGLRVFSPES